MFGRKPRRGRQPMVSRGGVDPSRVAYKLAPPARDASSPAKLVTFGKRFPVNLIFVNVSFVWMKSRFDICKIYANTLLLPD
jgi:hypothetical protein